MALPLPSLSLTKTAVFGLAVAVIAGVVWVTSLERPEGPTRSAKTEGSATRRGDDPTYADELRKLTALLQDMRYRFDQTENQRILDQDRLSDQTRTATAALARQSKAEIERLNQALEEAKKALDQKIQEAAAVPTDAVLREQIEKLQAEQEALRRQLAGEGGPGSPSEAGSDRRPEANRILNPSSASRPNDTAPGALELAPGAEPYRARLQGHYELLLRSLSLLKDHAALARYAEDLCGAELGRDAWARHFAGYHFARCAAVLNGDDTLTVAQRDTLRAEYGAQCVAALQRAFELGWRDWELRSTVYAEVRHLPSAFALAHPYRYG